MGTLFFDELCLMILEYAVFTNSISYEVIFMYIEDQEAKEVNAIYVYIQYIISQYYVRHLDQMAGARIPTTKV